MNNIALFKKAKTKKEVPLPKGRISAVTGNLEKIAPFRSKTTNLLNELKSTYDAIECIQLMIKKSPDVSMAHQTLLRLANQGFSMEFMGNASEDMQEEWREFASRVNSVSSAGFDGLIDQFHDSGFTMGGVACEVVVSADGKDIEDVYMVSPKTIHWELEERDGKEQYIPYQKVMGEDIDLSQGNFFWIPFDPDIGSPQGRLLFEPAIQAIEMQQQFFNSSQVVLYRIGVPRYVFTLNKESIVQEMPNDKKNNPIESAEWLNKRAQSIAGELSAIGAENDFIVFDDTAIESIGGDSAFFQGIGAYADVIDTQVMNALKMLGTLMNRRGQGSYALSTVEFKIVVDMVESMRKSSKRMAENIARVWCRAKGYDVQPKFTHKPIDWQELKDQIDYKLKHQEFVRKSQEYGWIDEDKATQEVTGDEKAINDGGDLYQFVKLQEQDEKSGGDTDE